VQHAAGEPVELGDDEAVALTALDPREGLLELAPLDLPARLVEIREPFDDLAPRGLGRVRDPFALVVEADEARPVTLLVAPANPGDPDVPV
jgi:hypothetical protein